jgi:flagellar hook-associated protein 2
MAIPVVSFTAGGIDVESIVQGLMQVERQPISLLQSRQAKMQLQNSAVGRLRASLESLRTMAGSVISGGVGKLSSSVSSSAVIASLSPTASAGSVTFTVDKLARSHGLRSASNVASNSSVITTAATFAMSTNAVGLGISSVRADASVDAGNYTVSVLQATAGATRTGTSVVAPASLIAGSNTLNLEIDGALSAITIAPPLSGSYDAAGLLDAVQTALDATGRLRLTTTHEGSVATLKVLDGTANAALGLATDGAATAGTNGSIKIGTDAAVTVTSAGINGATKVVTTGDGDFTFTLDGGLRVGEAKVAVISTGDRSLTNVVAAINGANTGATAAAVKVADGAWILQLTSSRSGTDNAMALDATAFGAGGLLQTSGAQDAKITIGTGAGAYSVEASGNTFTDVLAGVTLTATAESATAVTVSVSRNDAASADGVGKLIDAANSLLADIKMQTSYDPVTKTQSPLGGDASVRRLADEVRATISALVADGDTRVASSIGINTTRTGTLTFDRDVFIAALSANPAGIERLFGRGGTSTGAASFATATDLTIAGEYEVVITAAATRAKTVIPAASLGTMIGVRVGTVTATFQPAVGATVSDIVAGMNEALASNGLKVNAEADGFGGISLTAVGYGSNGSFESNLDVGGAGSWVANAGIDVAGTIDDKVAIGNGQRLILLDNDTSPARGLAIDVTALVPSTFEVAYNPGIAARLVSLAVLRTGEHSSLTSAKTSYDTRIASYTDQIEKFEERLISREAAMRRQWTAVQTLLSSLQNQGDWLSSQAESMAKSNQ